MAVIACELWSLIDDVCIRDYDVAWRNAVRCAVKFPPDTHSHFLPSLINVLSFYDDIYKRSVSFVISCLTSDSIVVRSVAECGICARQHVCCKRAYAIAIPSVRLSVCHTGDSCKNG